MRLLITGPFRDFSGYSHFGRNLVKALDLSGADISIRAIEYDDYKYQPTERESELFKRPIDNCDIVWQLTTPNEIRYVPNKMNISFFFWETTRIPVYWVQQLNLMDVIIVPCRFNAMVLQQCGVRKPVCVCHPPFDTKIYSQNYEPFTKKEFKDRIIYYNICQLSSKKGIDVLLRSYFRAFYDIPDEVVLILKFYLNMVNRKNEIQFVKQMIDHIKKGMRLPINKYPPVFLIDNVLSDEDIFRLHKTCDVYVCSSRGEGWGIPPFEAMAMGNYLISNTWGGLGDFVTKDNAIIYPAYQSIVYDQPHSDPYLYTGLEEWGEPDDYKMMLSMRTVHETIKNRGKNCEEHKKQLNKLREQGVRDTKQFDISLVGPKIYDTIKKIYQNWKDNNGRVVIDNKEIKISEA